MTLPLSANRTYVAGDPVSASDLDDLQEQVIASWRGRRPSKPLALSAVSFVGTGWSLTAPSRTCGTTGSKDNGRVALRLGDKVAACVFSYRKASASNMLGEVIGVVEGVSSVVATIALDGAATTWLTKSVAFDYRLVTDTSMIYVRITGNTVGDKHAGAEFTSGHPVADSRRFAP